MPKISFGLIVVKQLISWLTKSKTKSKIHSIMSSSHFYIRSFFQIFFINNFLTLHNLLTIKSRLRSGHRTAWARARTKWPWKKILLQTIYNSRKFFRRPEKNMYIIRLDSDIDSFWFVANHDSPGNHDSPANQNQIESHITRRWIVIYSFANHWMIRFRIKIE